MFHHSLHVSHHTTYGAIVYRLQKKNPCSDVRTRCFLHFQMAGWLPIFTISYSVQRKKNSLIITISYGWTLLCDGLSTWEVTEMNSGLWHRRRLLGRQLFVRKQESQNKEGKASSPEIGITTNPATCQGQRFPVAPSGRQNFTVSNNGAAHTASSPIDGSLVF